MRNYNTPDPLFESSDQILNAEFPEIPWVIEGLLPSGLTIVIGLPKVEKSWLSLQTAQAVGGDLNFLGQKTKHGPVRYLALEDF